jgi:hypothetical protein
MLSISASSGEPMDIVVLFDMSRNDSLAHFEQTRDYISGSFLREFVRQGDTFHLISFGDAPRLELSRHIEGEGDYRTIIGRLLLLYPLAQSSSVENAAEYTQMFVNGLPAERNKKVVFFTAKNEFSAAEIGTRFNENTQLYLAALPSSFGTLSSGRRMTPLATKPSPTRSPAPVPEVAAHAKPDVPPVEILLPDVSIVPSEPSLAIQPLPDEEYEPALFDKFKAAMIFLPLSLTLLLCTLVFACIVIWKKTVRTNAETYASNIEDYLYRLNKSASMDGMVNIAVKHPFSQGLLQKASKVAGQ